MKKILNYFSILFGIILLDILLLLLAICWPSQISVTIRRLGREITKSTQKKKK